METNIEKGRNMVIIAICIMLGVSLLNFLLNQISGVNENFFVWVVRFLLTCLLCYFIYNGHSWAKWLSIVLLGITCVLSLIGTLSIFLSLLLGLQSFLLFAAYLTVILILLIPQSVRDYFNSLKKAM